jgi:alpha-D-ribose 1-methylphosphonate 5-triphosphate synthase subunit PhnI
MAYTAVRGGQAAIQAAEALIAEAGRARLPIDEVRGGLRLLVDQVMGEGGLYAPELAALAIGQAEGDPIEAAFLLRAYRSTLPRIGYSLPSSGAELRVRRRISSAFKEIPGGQVLGRTRDYTQRLLDLDGSFAARALASASANGAEGPNGASDEAPPPAFPKVIDTLRAEGLMPPVPPRPPGEAKPEPEPFDVTRDAPAFPAPRSARLQALARGETGFMVALAYSVMRGFGAGHPTIAELRAGELPVRIAHPLTGNPVTIGHVDLTEVEAVSHASSGVGAGAAGNLGLDADRAERAAPRFDFGYGAVFGGNERKAIAMAILDTSLSIPGNTGPAADEEFVLQHCDPLESSGFVEHLKLPHYVTFQSQLDRLRYARLAKLAGTAGAGS